MCFGNMSLKRKVYFIFLNNLKTKFSSTFFRKSEILGVFFIHHDKYKVGNKSKNKLKSAKRFRNNHRQCSTDKS